MQHENFHLMKGSDFAVGNMVLEGGRLLRGNYTEIEVDKYELFCGTIGRTLVKISKITVSTCKHFRN
jgi:hypothetical protein